MQRWNISAPTFWRYRKKGLIPAPDRRIGTNHVWLRETILSAERRTDLCIVRHRPRPIAISAHAEQSA
jgi:hypothetical protein